MMVRPLICLVVCLFVCLFDLFVFLGVLCVVLLLCFSALLIGKLDLALSLSKLQVVNFDFPPTPDSASGLLLNDI